MDRRDTHPEVRRMLIERLRALTPAERLARVSAMTVALKRLALAGIRQRHPQASDRECDLRLASLYLDAETMRRAFGWDVAEKGRG